MLYTTAIITDDEKTKKIVAFVVNKFFNCSEIVVFKKYSEFIREIQNVSKIFSIVFIDLNLDDSNSWSECIAFDRDSALSYFLVSDKTIPIQNYLKKKIVLPLNDKDYILHVLKMSTDVKNIEMTELVKLVTARLEEDKLYREIKTQYRLIVDGDAQRSKLKEKVEIMENLNRIMREQVKNDFNITRETVCMAKNSSLDSVEILEKALETLDQENIPKTIIKNLLTKAKEKMLDSILRVEYLIEFCHEKQTENVKIDVKEALEYALKSIHSLILEDTKKVSITDAPSCQVAASPLMLKNFFSELYKKYFSNQLIESKAVFVSINDFLKQEVNINLDFACDREIDLCHGNIEKCYGYLCSSRMGVEFDQERKVQRMRLFFPKAN